MQWTLITSTFAAMFLAEMGDKTQLAAFALAGAAPSKWAVFLGASLALVATTAIAVLAGGLVGRYVPALWLKRAAGLVFIAIGVAFLLARAEPPEPRGSSSSPSGTESERRMAALD